MFNRVGEIVYPAKAASAEAMFEAALEAGADNVESTSENHVVTCAVDDFSTVRDALEARFGEPESAGLVWKPPNGVPVDEEAASSGLKLLDAPDDHDDS